MLEKIREGSQGPVAKVILGAVILSFALTGVYSYLGGNAEMQAAQVNGEEISRYDLDRALQNEQSRMRAQLGDMFDTLAADPGYMAGLRQQVLDGLIAERLIDQKVADLGLRVSDSQIKDAIANMAEFQVDGQFDNERYQAVLRQSNLTGTQLRDILRRDMSRQQLMIGLLGSEFVTTPELSDLAALQQQRRDIQLVILAQADFDADIQVTDAEVEQYYQDNLAQFSTPQQVAVEYVELSVNDMATEVTVSDEEAQAHYDAQGHRYTQPERRLAAHMLFQGDDAQERAEAALARVRAGEAFADVAKGASDDSFTADNGGEIDWMTQGQMEPAFDQALFALEAGGTSDAFESEFGYQIVHAKEIAAGTQKPFEDVKTEIIAEVQKDKAQAEFYDLQQKMADVSFEVPDSLVETAEAIGGEVKTTELFSRATAPGALANPRALAAAFSDAVLLDGMNSEPVEIESGHILVLRVAQEKPAGTESLEVVSDRIQASLKADKASAKAQSEADALVSQWQGGEAPEGAEAHAGLTRMGAPELDPVLVQQVFKLAKPADGERMVSSVRLGNGDVAVFALEAVEAGSLAEGQGDMLRGQVAQRYSESDYQALLSALRAEAEILYMEQAEQ